MKAPFPIQPHYTAIAIAYANARMVADSVLPRVPVNSQEYRFNRYNKADRFTIPETLVGRTSKPNEIEFGATETPGMTTDHALDSPVPQADIDNAPAGYDPRGNSVESIMQLIGLDREKRVADLVFDPAQYAAANKTTLAGTDQWNDYGNSEVLVQVEAAMTTVIMRPNVGLMGRAVFTQVRSHPDIAKAVHGNSGDKGMATAQQLADLWELDELLIGDAWYNSAKAGQAPVFSRLWGKHFVLFHRNNIANVREGITFGMSPQWGTAIAGSNPDPDIGMRGGERVRAGESLDEIIVANDVAYMFENAVA